MKEAYVIGVDFGSDSVRAIVKDVINGTCLSESECGYSRWLAGKYQDADKRIFRQHPLDYLEALESCVVDTLSFAGENIRKKVVGIGVDATGSTPAPVNEEGLPLALLPEFQENENAMFHLWKDHSSIQEAVAINQIFKNYEKTNYLKYQGTYSSEWYWAKILHTAHIDDSVKKAAYSWVELCDWIPAILCGNINPKTMYRCTCAAGHKALWHSEWNGLPVGRSLEKIDPYLKKISESYGNMPLPADYAVGVITAEWAIKLGIPKNTIIGGSSLDAHAGAVGAGIKKHTMVTNIGTSTVNMLIEDAKILTGKKMAHACGQAENSIIPGFVGIETSQAAFGDIYAWFIKLLLWPVKNIVENIQEINKREKDFICRHIEEQLLVELGEQAQKLSIEDSLIALDWFNGRRYPDTNELLYSAINGLTLGTDAPQIYQALIMATVFGQKRIIDSLQEQGIRIDEMIAVGGITRKSPYIMQMLADVLRFPIKVSASSQACANGAAIYAAVACGIYRTIPEAQKKLQGSIEKMYIPNKKNKGAFEKAYSKYKALGKFVENDQIIL